jgi:hypothetical protein
MTLADAACLIRSREYVVNVGRAFERHRMPCALPVVPRAPWKGAAVTHVGAVALAHAACVAEARWAR